MANKPERAGTAVPVTQTRLLGSLREALAAAGREDKAPTPVSDTVTTLPAVLEMSAVGDKDAKDPNTTVVNRGPSAIEAARQARGVYERSEHVHVEMDTPTTRMVRGNSAPSKSAEGDDAERTRLVRGKSKAKAVEFFQDPVVGWLVIVAGPGVGAYRPIYEGNNTVGRSKSQRIPIDFGDDTISNEEQAFIRYDSADRTFLLVPNLAKTNIVALNDRKPTGAVELAAMDLITMGRTQLVFVPFCGAEFDWTELTELKG
ncbi:MAG: FHA domain-containing protein [Sphingomonadales bacterium]|nr:FHA domain-containing protein [Sphingomonadales bacterium]